ncbi:phage holin family protein [Evansella sp. AB-P1]|uniref:phage holin family protein n=1 Tax=Evansella sp. AB-P1 TaxID=3037653 RepID=UPI00241FCB92|nr:phage holin family protein [Evansella sp. AB-P1]MDG5786623.1 phage holin family protein [Evansella sp. AB-P1]
MKVWILQLFVHAITLLIIAHFMNGVEISGIGIAILASFILSFVNAIVKPILVVLTLPITVLTLGLFLLVINGMTLMLTSFIMGSSFVISGLGTAIIAAIIFTVLNTLINSYVVDPVTKR